MLTLSSDSVNMGGMTDHWTLDELVRRATEALAAADVRPANGRVTGVPDGRLVRWYATIGLMDRPGAMRGRTALYGPRHLLQLVVVKRRQAEGIRLADIQWELAGATDDTLRRVAGVAPEVVIGGVYDAPAGSGHAGARHRPPSDSRAQDSPLAQAADPMPTQRAEPVVRTRFWSAHRASQGLAVGAGVGDQHPPRADRMSTLDPGPGPGPSADHYANGGEGGRGVADVLSGVPLGGGATLLLPATPTDDDLIAIAAAAGPLLAVLVARGLSNSSIPRSEGAPA